MKQFKQILNTVISEQLSDEPVALLFSGGTDSLTILWTLLDLGIKPTCYTFHLSYFESTDAKVSKKACNHWGVNQVIVNEDKRDIPSQLKDVISIIQSPRKTHVEVMYAYYFLMQAVKEKHIFSGIQADSLYGSNKNAAIQCGKQSAKFFADYRRKLVANPDQEGYKQANLLASHFNKILYTPYSDNRIREFYYQYSWKQLNSPKQKMPPILSFEDRFKEMPIYRIDDNLQCGSHIREHLADYVKQYKRIYENVNN